MGAGLSAPTTPPSVPSGTGPPAPGIPQAAPVPAAAKSKKAPKHSGKNAKTGPLQAIKEAAEWVSANAGEPVVSQDAASSSAADGAALAVASKSASSSASVADGAALGSTAADAAPPTVATEGEVTKGEVPEARGLDGREVDEAPQEEQDDHKVEVGVGEQEEDEEDEDEVKDEAAEPEEHDSAAARRSDMVAKPLSKRAAKKQSTQEKREHKDLQNIGRKIAQAMGITYHGCAGQAHNFHMARNHLEGLYVMMAKNELRNVQCEACRECVLNPPLLKYPDAYEKVMEPEPQENWVEDGPEAAMPEAVNNPENAKGAYRRH
jgi:hypothetical protein